MFRIEEIEEYRIIYAFLKSMHVIVGRCIVYIAALHVPVERSPPVVALSWIPYKNIGYHTNKLRLRIFCFRSPTKKMCVRAAHSLRHDNPST